MNKGKKKYFQNASEQKKPQKEINKLFNRLRLNFLFPKKISHTFDFCF